MEISWNRMVRLYYTAGPIRGAGAHQIYHPGIAAEFRRTPENTLRICPRNLSTAFSETKSQLFGHPGIRCWSKHRCRGEHGMTTPAPGWHLRSRSLPASVSSCNGNPLVDVRTGARHTDGRLTNRHGLKEDEKRRTRRWFTKN
jgi:hypothetical protein